MIRSSALVMSGLMAVVAAATYFGLGYLPPGLIPGIGAKPDEQQVAHSVESKDEPAATTMPAEPVADTAEVAAEPAAVDPAAATPEVAEAPAAVPAATSKSDYASSEEIERALAAEPPPEEDVKPAAKAKPAPAPKPVAEAQPAPAVGPAAASAKPAEKPATPPAAKTSSAPPAAAPSASAGDKSSSSMTPAAGTAPASTPSNERTADADAIKQWWPDPAKMPANQLKLVYAGQVQGQLAIALLFSDAVNLETLKQNAEVKTANGTPVSGGVWEAGKNPKLAIFRGLEAGRHTVVLGPTIAGTGGFMLGTALQGPVYVKAP